jgi:hypothetical protein
MSNDAYKTTRISGEWAARALMPATQVRSVESAMAIARPNSDRRIDE